MQSEFQNNYSTLSVSELIEKLLLLFTPAIINRFPLKELPTPFLWGPPGIGKSKGVLQFAKALGRATMRKEIVTDVRLSLMSPVDGRGIPVADAKKEFTVWLMPKIFAMDPSERIVNILFLDELSSAPPAMQQVAYQICYDRKIGEFSFPDNCIVIAAGNRTIDQGAVYKMDKALANRQMHFEIRPEYATWREWAVANGVNDKVIAYLAMDNSRLNTTPDRSQMAFATPRTWNFVSNMLNLTGRSPEELHELIAGCVGIDVALEFEAFCRGSLQMPSIDEVVKGRCRELPRSHDVMYAMVSALIARLQQQGDALTDEELDNICIYVNRFPRDFVMSFMKDAILLPNMASRLMRCHSLQNWLNKNKSFLV